jgi:hypothetical protein
MMGSARKMRFQVILIALFTSLLFLAACGGGYTHPYDGTWMAVYPDDSHKGSKTDTEITVCSTTPGTLALKDGVGNAIQTIDCTTTYLATSAVPSPPPPFTESWAYIIGASIERSDVSGGKDVLNAIVNGGKLTGQCISLVACEASNGTNTLSLTR